MKFELEIKDPGSAITHFIGMLMAVFAATPLLIRAIGKKFADTDVGRLRRLLRRGSGSFK